MLTKLGAVLAALVTAAVVAGPLGGSPAAGARPHHPHGRVALTLAFDASSYDAPAHPVLTYTWRHKANRDVLHLQQLVDGHWADIRKLREARHHRGTATLALDQLRLGHYVYRVVAMREDHKAGKALASALVFGPVPITELIAASPSTNASIHSGTTMLGGQSFPYLFDGFLSGADVWRTVLALRATSCKGIGIPLGSKRHDDSTGGTFAMQALGASDAVLASNSAAPDVGAGLLFPVAVGSPLTVQVKADRPVDYFGAGQGLCYTEDGALP